MKRILVTGGSGFIGSALIRKLISSKAYEVLNIDKLTYSGNVKTLEEVNKSPHYQFVEGDICDIHMLHETLSSFKPNIITHLAAETHVDRSIDNPEPFLFSNVIGTFKLLEATRAYFTGLPLEQRDNFRFHHISTDEVYGSLGPDGLFTERTAYDPRSPYSASKASSDHLVRAWGYTFGLPVIVTNCSNNYGPYQFPEKLIPLIISRAILGENLPVYGKGLQIRDWLYVDDHVEALQCVFERGKIGGTYNIGGNNEKQNIDVVRTICELLDKKQPAESGLSYSKKIIFVADRPGHDRRYAIDSSRINEELRWQPKETFESGIEKTLDWYLANKDWLLEVAGEDGSLERRGLVR